MSARDVGKKTTPTSPPPRQGSSPSAPPAAEPRVVVNASLLDDVEIHGELPPGVEVWTPGGVRPAAKPMIPSKVDLWMPDDLKGPRPGSAANAQRAAALKNLPPPRAQQATMLLPVTKRRNRHKSVAALSVAAFLAALAMLAGVLAWRYWRKTPAPLVRELPTRADKSDAA